MYVEERGVMFFFVFFLHVEFWLGKVWTGSLFSRVLNKNHIYLPST